MSAEHLTENSTDHPPGNPTEDEAQPETPECTESTLAVYKTVISQGYTLTFPNCTHSFRDFGRKQEDCPAKKCGRTGRLLEVETDFPIRINRGEKDTKFKLRGKWSGERWTFQETAIDACGGRVALTSLPPVPNDVDQTQCPEGPTIVGLWFIVGADGEVCDDVEGHPVVTGRQEARGQHGQPSSVAVDGFELMKLHGWHKGVLSPMDVLHYLFDKDWCNPRDDTPARLPPADTFLLSDADAKVILSMTGHGHEPSMVRFSRQVRTWVSNPVDLDDDSELQTPSTSVSVADQSDPLMVQVMYSRAASDVADDASTPQMPSRPLLLQTDSNNVDDFPQIWCLEILVNSNWKVWLKETFDGFDYDSYYGKLGSLARQLGLKITPEHGERESDMSMFLRRVEVTEDDDDDEIGTLFQLVSQNGRLHGVDAKEICAYHHKVKAYVTPVNEDDEDKGVVLEREFKIKEFLKESDDHPNGCSLEKKDVKERLKQALRQTIAVIDIKSLHVVIKPYEEIECEVYVDDLTFKDLTKDKPPLIIDDRRFATFHSQEKVAKKIIDRLLLVLNSEYPELELKAPQDLKNVFRGVKCFVMTTQHISLFEQTSAEAQEYLEDFDVKMLKHAGWDTGESPQNLKELHDSVTEAIKEYKDGSKKPHLHVLIDDECHTSLKSTNYHGKYLNLNLKNEIKYNDAPVFVVLSVSATPYAVLSRNSRVPAVFLHKETQEKIVVDPRRFRPPPGSKTLEECTVTVGDHAVSLKDLENNYSERNVIHWRVKKNDETAPVQYMSLDKYLREGKIKGSEDGFSRFYNYWSGIFFQDKKSRPGGAEEPIQKDASLLLAVEYTYCTCLLATLEKWRVSGEGAADFFIECLKESMNSFPSSKKRGQDIKKSKLALFTRVLIGISSESESDWQKFLWSRLMTAEPYDATEKTANKALRTRLTGFDPSSTMMKTLETDKILLNQLLTNLKKAFAKKRDITEEIDKIDKDAENPSSVSKMKRKIEEQSNSEFDSHTMNILYSLAFEQYEAQVEDKKITVGKLALVRMTHTDGAGLFLAMVRETMRIVYKRLCENGIRTLKPWKIWQDTGKQSVRQFVSADYEIGDDKDMKVTYREMTCPCILLLVEKGRMGDRFFHDTGNSKLRYRLTGVDCSRGLGLAVLDLRIRHAKSVGTAATIIQEFGRVCRYSDANNICLLPSILVSPYFFKEANVEQASKILDLKFDSPDQTLQFVHKKEFSKKWASSHSRFLCAPRTNMQLNDESLVEAHKLRLVLKAEPQMGKTGVYLHFLRFLCDSITCENSDVKLPVPPSNVHDLAYRIHPWWKDLVQSRRDVVTSFQRETSSGNSSMAGTKPGKYHSHKMVERLMGLKSAVEKGQSNAVVSSLASLFGGKDEAELVAKITNDILGRWKRSAGDDTEKSSTYVIFNVQTEGNLRLAEKFVNLDGMFRESMEVAIQPLCGFIFNNCIYLPTSAKSDFWIGSRRSTFQPQQGDYPQYCATVPNSDCGHAGPQSIPEITVDPPISSGYKSFAVKVSYAPNVDGFPGRRWIFHPSARPESAKLCLPGITKPKQDKPAFYQAIVVQPSQFDVFRKRYQAFTIVCLPHSLSQSEGGITTVEDGGIGFSRLVIQLLASHQGLDVIVMSDDRVRAMGMLTPNRSWEYTEFDRPIDYLYNVISNDQSDDTEDLNLEKTNRRGHDLVVKDMGDHKQLLEDYNQNPIDNRIQGRETKYHFSDADKCIAMVGCTRNPWGRQLDDMKKVKAPFVTSLSIYSTFVLNVKLTVEREVFYRPTKVWEDIYFLRDCHRANLFTVKSRCVWLVRDTNPVNAQTTAPSHENLAKDFADLLGCSKDFFWTSEKFRTSSAQMLYLLWLGARQCDNCMSKIIESMRSEGEKVVRKLSMSLGAFYPYRERSGTPKTKGTEHPDTPRKKKLKLNLLQERPGTPDPSKAKGKRPIVENIETRKDQKKQDRRVAHREATSQRESPEPESDTARRVEAELTQAEHTFTEQIEEQEAALNSVVKLKRDKLQSRLDSQKEYHEEQKLKEAFRVAIEAGNLDSVEELLNKHPPLVHAVWCGTFFNGKSTALHLLSLESGPYYPTGSHLEILKLLLRKGADIEAKNSDGGTPLHKASKSGHHLIVEELLRKGADIDAKNEFGYTPLHYACERGHKSIVELLLSSGSNVNIMADDEFTPLGLTSDESIQQLLLSKGAVRAGRVLVENWYIEDSVTEEEETKDDQSTGSQDFNPTKGGCPFAGCCKCESTSANEDAGKDQADDVNSKKTASDDCQAINGVENDNIGNALDNNESTSSNGKDETQDDVDTTSDNKVTDCADMGNNTCSNKKRNKNRRRGGKGKGRKKNKGKKQSASFYSRPLSAPGRPISSPSPQMHRPSSIAFGAHRHGTHAQVTPRAGKHV